MRHISSLIGILFLTAFFIFGAGIYHANARLVKEVYVGDPGYPTFTESVATLNATGTSCTLYVPAGIHTVNDDLTVNSNVCLISRKVTAIRIESAKTLTINGPFEAGLYQVFDCIGTGKVVLGAGAVKEVYPQWWGGTGAAQVQAAIDSCAGPQVILVPGTYALGTTSLSLTKSYINFKALPGTKITYSGTGAAFLINPTSGILSNINVEFDLLVQNNAEAVGIKLDGDGWVQYSKFNWNWIDGTYNSAVVLAGAGLKNVNRFTGEKITSTRGSFQYGIKIPDGKTLFEGNRFDVGSIAGARTEGVYFGNTAWHNYFIGDVGNDNKANYSKVRIEGSRNTIQITGAAPLQDLFDQPAAPGEKEWYPTIHLGPNAVYNTIIISPHMMGGIIEEISTPGVWNNWVVPHVQDNLLKDPSFESTDITAWTAKGLAATHAISDNVKHGRFSRCLQTDTKTVGYLSQNLPLYLANTEVTLCGWFLCPTNAGQQTLELADDTRGGEESNYVTIPHDGKWHFMAVTKRIREKATSIQARIYADKTGVLANYKMYGDGLVLTRGLAPCFP